MSSQQKELAILILAAGASTRMGEIKQLLPWKGNTMLGHTIMQAKQVSNAVFVVLGANSEVIEEKLNQNVTIFKNTNWKDGMGSSIAFGVSQLKRHSYKAVLIMLADQPFLTADYLMKLKEQFLSFEYDVVATSYPKKNGVPAIFDKTYFSQLELLNKDSGAQHIIKAADNIMTIDPKDRAIDIDTIEVYEQLKTKSDDKI